MCIQDIYQRLHLGHSILSCLWHGGCNPNKIHCPTFRTEALDKTNQKQVLREQLLLVKEKQGIALINLETYHQRIRRYISAKMKRKQFQKSDQVLRQTTCNTKELNIGKLRAKQEEPYLVVENPGSRAYRLQSPTGIRMEKTQNTLNLKRYYQKKEKDFADQIYEYLVEIKHMKSPQFKHLIVIQTVEKQNLFEKQMPNQNLDDFSKTCLKNKCLVKNQTTFNKTYLKNGCPIENQMTFNKTCLKNKCPIKNRKTFF